MEGDAAYVIKISMWPQKPSQCQRSLRSAARLNCESDGFPFQFDQQDWFELFKTSVAVPLGDSAGLLCGVWTHLPGLHQGRVSEAAHANR